MADAIKEIFEKGVKKGIPRGIEKGIQQGIQEKKTMAVKNLKNMKYPTDKIKLITGLSEEKINEIDDDLEEIKKMLLGMVDKTEQEGIEKGIEIGIKKGIKTGMEQENKTIAEKMKELGYSTEEIFNIIATSEDEIITF